MWILDSISDVELKKPFLILWVTLGAAFLLLTRFLVENPLYHPITYALLGITVYLIWAKRKNLWWCIAMLAAGLSSIWLLPTYASLFAILFSLATGKIVFPENFRLWKGFACASLLAVSFPILATWQTIRELQIVLPYPFSLLIHAAVMAFCVQFALLPFQIRKDSVLEAFDHYSWHKSYEAFTHASDIVILYEKIKSMMRAKETNPQLQQDLEDYTERVLHQCFRLQEITRELSNLPLASLQQTIAQLKEKLASLEDITTKIQYEQALHNKQKQLDQYESIQVRAERLLAQIINYASSLENVRFAYANQDLQKSSGSTENIEVFMDLVKARAEGFSL
jgi:hypothetical protein